MYHVVSLKELAILLLVVAFMFAVSYSSNFSGLPENRATGFVTSPTGTQLAQQTLTVLPATGIKAGDTITIKSFANQKLTSHWISIEAYSKDGILMYQQNPLKDCSKNGIMIINEVLSRSPRYCEASFTIPINYANLVLRIDAHVTTTSLSSLGFPNFFIKDKIFYLPPPSNDNCGRIFNDWTCDDTQENCGPSYIQGKSMESCHECQTGGFNCQEPCAIYKLDEICDDTKQNCGDAYSPGVSIDACRECSIDSGGFDCEHPCDMYLNDDICDDTPQKCGKFYQSGVSVDICGECSKNVFPPQIFEIATGNKCAG